MRRRLLTFAFCLSLSQCQPDRFADNIEYLWAAVTISKKGAISTTSRDNFPAK